MADAHGGAGVRGGGASGAGAGAESSSDGGSLSEEGSLPLAQRRKKRTRAGDKAVIAAGGIAAVVCFTVGILIGSLGGETYRFSCSGSRGTRTDPCTLPSPPAGVPAR